MGKGATRYGVPRGGKGELAEEIQNDEMMSARRGGGKRKRGTNKETQKHDNVAKKKSRVTKPQEEKETEYLEEKRNLEDMWKAAFAMGTDALYGLNWDFKNLEEALEEGGFLHGKKVYVLGFAELQHCLDKDREYFVNVPTVVVIESNNDPSKELAIRSLQRSSEEGTITMKEKRTGWVPYIPLEERVRQIEKTSSRIFTLFCNQRRAAVRNKKEEHVEYCLPYFSEWEEDDFEDCSTEVYIRFPSTPPVTCLFDWEFDDLDGFADELIKFKGLSEEVKDEFKELVEDRVRAGKKAHQAARDRRAIERMRRIATRQASENMKLYKFYPRNPQYLTANMTKSPFINRFYGNAHKVF